MKEAVLPFNRFPEADAVLGPEMRSTGEVMGIDLTFGLAFAKSQIAAGDALPERGTVFLSLADRDKALGCEAARAASSSSASRSWPRPAPPAACAAAGIPVGKRRGQARRRRATTRVELIDRGKVQLVVNSPRGRGPRADGAHIRRGGAAQQRAAAHHRAPPLAAANGMADWARHQLQVRTLQEYHRGAWRAEQFGSED